MWGREEWRTRGDDLRTFLADFASFLSQLRRWIKSTVCSGAIGDMSGNATYQDLTDILNLLVGSDPQYSDSGP